MKVVLLSAASSIHTIRWANGLVQAGVEVHVISQHSPIEEFLPQVKFHRLPYRGVLGYFLMVPRVKRLLSSIQPDIVNAHYASGYGTTARLVNRRPWVLSVWGSDIYDFPTRGLLHRTLVRGNLRSADAVASTSHSMAAETRLLEKRLGSIYITPFGVELDAFGYGNRSYSVCEDMLTPAPIVIGTVKTMAPTYGIDILIEAFTLVRARLKKEIPQLASRLQLLLVGDGPQLEELRALVKQRGIDDITSFVGRVPHADVPNILSRLNIYVALSRIESFGVAVIEAEAAGLPVVVSNTGGLPEVTLDGVTGIVVESESATSAADAIFRLVKDPLLRKKMGDAGRQHVATHYSWPSCVLKMIDMYRTIIDRTVNID